MAGMALYKRSFPTLDHGYKAPDLRFSKGIYVGVSARTAIAVLGQYLDTATANASSPSRNLRERLHEIAEEKEQQRASELGQEADIDDDIDEY
ncbi:uncharacterized protein N7515_009519 [Penicillium bovifimosum]|uniref:Uncharacterized protein n=1 Tax=Penicillium bovifimosum TaxID=126998 RepID=A0A9W9GJG2_9EURO|nr:uncharacterized protein N7515_009519 [Penicillium bovifimosum]KAJ5121558.1 hypothetical protein N7515_009519 [Penicillium bovifimosum]